MMMMMMAMKATTPPTIPMMSASMLYGADCWPGPPEKVNKLPVKVNKQLT